MSMIKIAGITDNGNPVGLRVDDDGNIQVEHTWEADRIDVFRDLAITDTAAKWSDPIDISRYAIVSLRIHNSLDQPVTMQFGADTTDTTTAYLYDKNGSNIRLVANNDNKIEILTPEDLPVLHYLKHIRLRAQCDTAPTTGTLTVVIVGRR